MRTQVVVIAFLGGCYAALPPPIPPRTDGVVTATGGTLGTWEIKPHVGKPVDSNDVEALDLIDPGAPDHVLRFVRAPAEPQQLPRGIQEAVMSRGVELRLATTGDAPTEVVLDRSHCATLDAIFRFAHGHAFGSARFDCNLGVAGHATGDVEFAAGQTPGIKTITGHIEASDSTLATTRFEPDEAETDPKGVLFWDHRRPRVVFELEQLPSDASVLGTGSNAKLRVISTVDRVKSFELAPASCHTLRLQRSESGYVRIGTHQHTSWSGTIELDCTAPGGGRLTGSLELL